MSRFSLPLVLGAALALSACGNLERLSEVGRAPSMAPVVDPTQDPNWRPVSMPMPAAQPAPLEANSLWRPGSRTFLRDQRAAQVGDLVTVLVSIQDEAELENSTERNRNGTDSLGIPSLLGIPSSFARVFPNGVDPGNLISTNGTSASAGTGTIERRETVQLRVAATVAQVLPNGNLVVTGRQQVRVNHELRDLQVAGIIRPQDIGSDNTVKHDRLAEARISYGGRGTVSDVQSPRYGQQILDAILPF